MDNIYLENPEAGNDDIWGEFNPKLAANLTLAYINASVAVGSLEVLDTANLLTLSLGKLWRLSFPGMRLKIFADRVGRIQSASDSEFRQTQYL